MRHKLAQTLLLLLVAGTHGVAQNRWIVRMNSNGAKSVQQAAGGKWTPVYAPEGVYAVTGSSSIGQALQLLKSNPLVQSVEADAAVTLPESDSGYNSNGHKVPALVTSAGRSTFRAPMWCRGLLT